MKKTLYFFAIIALLLVLGCETVVPIELPEHKPVLVVNSSFNPLDSWVLDLSSSLSIKKNDTIAKVNNALVLLEDNGIVIDTFLNVGNGQYESSNTPIIGHNYTIRAAAEGFESVSGSDVIPSPVALQAISFRDSSRVVSNGPSYGEVSFSIDDPGNDENYYIAYVYQIDTFYNLQDTIIALNSIRPVVNDPTLSIDFQTSGILFTDATFNGQRKTVKIEIETYGNTQGRYFVGLSTCSQNYFKYVQTLSSFQETGFNPFAEPVLIHSNMSSKMGIFAGFAIDFQPVP